MENLSSPLCKECLKYLDLVSFTDLSFLLLALAFDHKALFNKLHGNLRYSRHALLSFALALYIPDSVSNLIIDNLPTFHPSLSHQKPENHFRC